MSWKQRIDESFGKRVELSFNQLCETFGLPAGSDHDSVRRAFALFEQEYGVPMGKLRPDDALTVFTEPPPSRNPLSWFFGRAAVEDKTSELSFQLKNERKRQGVPAIPAHTPGTVKDFIMSWLAIS